MENSMGAAISAARKAKGYTLAQASIESGVSVSYLSDIERGRKTPSIIVLKRIINALDIRIDTIFHNHA